MADEQNAEGPGVEEIEAPKSSGPGTVLIPAGQRTTSRTAESAESADPGEGGATDGNPNDASGVTPMASWPPAPSSSPDLAAAIAAATAARSQPPVPHPSAPPWPVGGLSSVPPTVGSTPPWPAGASYPPGTSMPPGSLPPGSLPPGGSLPAVDPQARLEDIKQRRSRRTAFVLIGLLLSAALLAGATVFVISSQRASAAQRQVEQVLTAHRVALDTTGDANELVAEELTSLTAADAPDIGSLTAVAQEASSLFDGLHVPVAEGEFVQLARGLQNAIDAELAFLARLEAFAATDLLEVRQGDIDPVLRAWDTAEDALRSAYADQPSLDVPDLTGTGDVVAAFASHVVAEAEAARRHAAEQEEFARERAAAIAEADAYRNEVQELFNELERLRDQLSRAAIRNRSPQTGSEYQSTWSTVEAAADGRYALANRMDLIDPPAAFSAIHTELKATFELLGDTVMALGYAIDEVYCGYDDFTDHYTCDTVGETAAYRDFVRKSDAAGARLDAAKAALFAKHGEVVRTNS
jgi:hypothetical protein